MNIFQSIFQENKVEENNPNEGAKNIRQILDSFLNVNRRKMIFSIICAFISLLSFFLYVISTYIQNLNEFLDKFDIIVFIIYLLEYLTSVILAHDRINHMLTTNCLLDLFTTITIFMGFVNILIIIKFYLLINNFFIFK